jgi:hypothetical protein
MTRGSIIDAPATPIPSNARRRVIRFCIEFFYDTCQYTE